MLRWRYLPSKTGGYTLVELLMAMALGSFLILAITGGIIRLYHMYEAGTSLRSTQQSVRTITDDISIKIRDAEGYRVVQASTAISPSTNLRQDRLCVFDSVAAIDPSSNGGAVARVQGSVYYISRIGTTSTLRRAALQNTLVWSASSPSVTPAQLNDSCPTATNGFVASSVETLSEQAVSVVDFGVNRTAGFDNRLVTFNLGVANAAATTEQDINYTNPNALTCTGAFSQFCSITQVSTSATLRQEVSS